MQSSGTLRSSTTGNGDTHRLECSPRSNTSAATSTIPPAIKEADRAKRRAHKASHRSRDDSEHAGSPACCQVPMGQVVSVGARHDERLAWMASAVEFGVITSTNTTVNSDNQSGLTCWLPLVRSGSGTGFGGWAVHTIREDSKSLRCLRASSDARVGRCTRVHRGRR